MSGPEGQRPEAVDLLGLASCFSMFCDHPLSGVGVESIRSLILVAEECGLLHRCWQAGIRRRSSDRASHLQIATKCIGKLDLARRSALHVEQSWAGDPPIQHASTGASSLESAPASPNKSKVEPTQSPWWSVPAWFPQPRKTKTQRHCAC
jgi:hypothetical protein